MIWRDCRGENQIAPIQGVLDRLVESQEHIATLGYVDTLEEQALLEDMLESVKPAWPDEARPGLHYLLKTPFRYPPLPWGSRFGRRHERGIFYGGLGFEATLAEAAYYRFLFWYSMAAPPIRDTIQSQHTLFSAAYRADRGIRLQAPPFDRHHRALTDPQDYTACQVLGTAMRDAGVQAFEYVSARDPAGGCCVGLFTPAALAWRAPRKMRPWLCQLGAREVSFKPVGAREVHVYRIEDFQVDGMLPWPAS